MNFAGSAADRGLQSPSTSSYR